MTGRHSYLIAGLITLGACGWTAPVRADVRYTITDLGPWRPYAINDDGVVVGYGPLVWKSGVTTIQVPGGGIAFGVSNLGQIVGSSVGPPPQGFVWREGTVSLLGTLGGESSIARGVNDAGVVVGSAKTPSQAGHAFTYANGVMSDLGTLGGTSSIALAVNNSGVVVGRADTGAPPPPGDLPLYRAFVYANGVMTPIAGDYSVGNDINDKGQVVGLGTGFVPFLWDAGAVTYLPPLGAYGLANAINEAGVVVGFGVVAGEHSASIWEKSIVEDLNDLIPVNSGWARLEEATDINESGQIVGFGETTDGRGHGFLLTPIPEPGLLALLLVGALPAARRTRRFRRSH